MTPTRWSGQLQLRLELRVRGFCDMLLSLGGLGRHLSWEKRPPCHMSNGQVGEAIGRGVRSTDNNIQPSGVSRAPSPLPLPRGKATQHGKIPQRQPQEPSLSCGMLFQRACSPKDRILSNSQEALVGCNPRAPCRGRGAFLGCLFSNTVFQHHFSPFCALYL